MTVTALRDGDTATAHETGQSAAIIEPAQQVVSTMTIDSVIGNYNGLTGKPSIESVVLMGNRLLDDFGMGLASYQSIFDLFE